MPRFDGTLALELDFGQTTTAATAALGQRSVRLQLAAVPHPDKYRILEHRRRQAQIKARHLLDLTEEN